jgi:TolB protein
MPDVKEVFEMVTKESKPKPGALQRQQELQRLRHRRDQISALAVAAAIVVAVAALAFWMKPAKKATPANQPSSSPVIQTRPLGAQFVSLDGKKIKKVTGIPAASYSTDLSPDGTKIAFVTIVHGGAAQIATISVDGSGYRVITHVPLEASYPSWSPDGRKIAFVSMNRSLNKDIYVMDANGTHVIRLTSGPAFDDAPAWSPDGKQIAYQSGSSLSSMDYTASDEEIWTVSTSGGAPVRLTNNGVSDEQPSWSPNGRWIAFGHNGTIDVMNADGTNIRELAGLPGTEGLFMPRWSPDGSKLAFLSCCQGAAQYGTFPIPNSGSGAVRRASVLKIFVMDMSGPTNGKPHEVAVTIATDASGVSWNPTSDALLIYRWNGSVNPTVRNPEDPSSSIVFKQPICKTPQVIYLGSLVVEQPSAAAEVAQNRNDSSSTG